MSLQTTLLNSYNYNTLNSIFLKLISKPFKKTFILGLLYFFYKNYVFLKNKNNKLVAILYLFPYFRNSINKKLSLETNKLEKNLESGYENFNHLPEKGTNESELNKKLELFKNNNSKKNISGIIYCNNELDIIVNKFYTKYSKTNPLHADIYPQIRNMEIDIVNVCKKLYKCRNNGCGSLTSGGTESILLACQTYRDYCKELENIEYPNIIGFNTIHPAFDKACHYFNIKLIKVHNLDQMRKQINSNTILLVVSAPDYPYGLIDPIYEVNSLALKYNKNIHIDACMGGFLLPFLEEFKYINFELPGVSSISMDTHKYGFAPKGSSVLLFKDFKIKKYQHFINDEWCGGVYATPTMLGSKPGGIIAGTWASLFLRGFSGFESISREINNNLKFIVSSISKIDSLEVIGNPKLNIVAVKSNTLDIYQVVNDMKSKNWVLSTMQNPPAFHFCVTDLHTKDICKKLCSDLESSCQKVLQSENTELKGQLAIYGGEDNLEKGLFVKEIIHDYIFLLSNRKISHRYK